MMKKFVTNIGTPEKNEQRISTKKNHALKKSFKMEKKNPSNEYGMKKSLSNMERNTSSKMEKKNTSSSKMEKKNISSSNMELYNPLSSKESCNTAEEEVIACTAVEDTTWAFAESNAHTLKIVSNADTESIAAGSAATFTSMTYLPVCAEGVDPTRTDIDVKLEIDNCTKNNVSKEDTPKNVAKVTTKNATNQVISDNIISTLTKAFVRDILRWSNTD